MQRGHRRRIRKSCNNPFSLRTEPRNLFREIKTTKHTPKQKSQTSTASRSMHMEGQPAWKSSDLPERPRVRTFENWAFSELFPHRCSGNYYRACPCVCARIRGAARCFVCDRLLGTHQAFHNCYLLLSLWCLISSVCPYFILGSHFLPFQILLKMAFYSYRLSNKSVFSQFNIEPNECFEILH